MKVFLVLLWLAMVGFGTWCGVLMLGGPDVFLANFLIFQGMKKPVGGLASGHSNWGWRAGGAFLLLVAAALLILPLRWLQMVIGRA